MPTLEARLRELYVQLPPCKHNPKWLGDEPNVAYLLCVGSGPWKIQRRVQVQARAIRWVLEAGGDITMVNEHRLWRMFPLDWQNRLVAHGARAARYRKQTFAQYMQALRVRMNAAPGAPLPPQAEQVATWFKECGCEPDKGAKVLWMFLRDWLGVPSFPIDRHVGAWLREHGFPVDSRRMVELCGAACVPASDFARRLFPADNPSRCDVLELAMSVVDLTPRAGRRRKNQAWTSSSALTNVPRRSDATAPAPTP